MWSYSAACFFGFSLLADRCGRRQAFEYLLFVVQIVAIQYDHPYRIWAGWVRNRGIPVKHAAVPMDRVGAFRIFARRRIWMTINSRRSRQPDSYQANYVLG
jgi:hypothetical protein